MTNTRQELEKFVNREVYYNVNELMQHLFTTEPDLYFYSFNNPYDYARCFEDYCNNDCYDPEKYEEFKEYIEENKPSSKLDWHIEACNFFDLDVSEYCQEPLEFWLVSDWLANKLEERGEMIAHDIHGLTVWGRTCSGQAILLDNVISEIYNS